MNDLTRRIPIVKCAWNDSHKHVIEILVPDERRSPERVILLPVRQFGCSNIMPSGSAILRLSDSDQSAVDPHDIFRVCGSEIGSPACVEHEPSVSAAIPD